MSAPVRAGVLLAALSTTLLLGMASAQAAKKPARVDTARIANAASEPANWLTVGGTYDEQRFSALDQVSTDSVPKLALAWSHDLDTSRGQEATPLVVDGVLYTTTAWSKVVALDAATGRELWTYDPKVPGAFGIKACCDVVNRGAAFYDGKVFVGTIDGRLVALNARTGKVVWSTVTVDQSKPYTITGAPRVAKGKVFIGNGGAEYGVRGYVSAYDARTGKLAWRFYTVPGKRGVPDGAASDEIMAKLAGPTWFGDKYWEYGGGGTVWDAIVYDAELDQLYIGTGNGSPWNHKIRSEGQGDNLFVSSIVALNPDTGKYLWHYQETPGESWDYTATQQMTLATLPVGGETHPVLLHAPKNGFFYVLDRRNGKLLSAEKFVPVNWAERVDLATGRPVEDPKARFVDEPFLSSSGAAGAHNWHPMSYDARSGVMYLPVQQIPFLYVRDQKFVFRAGEWNLGVDMMGNRLPTTPEGRAAMRSVLQGRLVAWDVKAQKEKWRVEYDRPWNGGALATAGNLVFQGTAIGTLRAYDARDGKLLWEFDTQSSILGGPMSYAVNGEQYVAVMVGNGGGLPLTLPAFDGPRPRLPGRVMAFKLGGTAKLPALDATLAAPNAPAEAFAPAQVEQGRVLYAQHCAACHGMETLSAGVLPDLRRSGLLTSAPAWKAVVVEGVLESRGMVSFGGKFDAAAAESIRAYVGSEARAAAAAAPAP